MTRRMNPTVCTYWRAEGHLKGARSVFRCSTIALLLMLIPASAVGQEWRIEPTAGAQLGYQDNVSLVVEDHDSSFVASARAAVRALRAVQNRSLALRAGLSLDRYTEVEDKDNTRAFVDVASMRRSERSNFGLNLNLSTQSTLTSETATTGPTRLNRQQFQLRLRPSWNYLLSERTSLNLSAGYTEVVYDNTAGTSLNNYRAGSLLLGYSFRISERAALSASGTYGLYSTQGVGTESENVGFQIGGEYQFSETLVADALVGLRQTEVRNAGPLGLSLTERSSGPSYSVGFRKTFAPGGGAEFRAVRELTPSGADGVLDTTSLRGNLRYPIGEYLGLRVGLRAYRNREPSGQRSNSDRTYAEGEAEIEYELSQAWRIRLGYRHRWQDRDAEPGIARANALLLTLAWRGF